MQDFVMKSLNFSYGHIEFWKFIQLTFCKLPWQPWPLSERGIKEFKTEKSDAD